MNEEGKQLLIKDLCGRLPHGVKFMTDSELGVTYELRQIFMGNLEVLVEGYYNGMTNFDRYNIETIKPYLRPMSSMTKEEYNEYQELYDYEERSYNQGCEFYDEWKVEINDEERLFKIADWLNAHHFDYRGLIERELALEAPEGMYNTK